MENTSWKLTESILSCLVVVSSSILYRPAGSDLVRYIWEVKVASFFIQQANGIEINLFHYLMALIFSYRQNYAVKIEVNKILPSFY
jgi:hypothetical protein